MHILVYQINCEANTPSSYCHDRETEIVAQRFLELFILVNSSNMKKHCQTTRLGEPRGHNCKAIILMRLRQEFGSTKTYIPASADMKSIVHEHSIHIAKITFRINKQKHTHTHTRTHARTHARNEQKQQQMLPTINWLPKFRKRLYRAYFIMKSSSRIAQLLTFCITGI